MRETERGKHKRPVGRAEQGDSPWSGFRIPSDGQRKHLWPATSLSIIWYIGFISGAGAVGGQKPADQFGRRRMAVIYPLLETLGWCLSLCLSKHIKTIDFDINVEYDRKNMCTHIYIYKYTFVPVGTMISETKAPRCITPALRWMHGAQQSFWGWTKSLVNQKEKHTKTIQNP